MDASPQLRHPLHRRNIVGLLAASSLFLSSCGVVAATPTTSMPSTFSEAAGSLTAPLGATAPPEGKPAPGRIPVYWLGLNGSNVFLYREFQPTESSGDPIVEADRKSVV